MCTRFIFNGHVKTTLAFSLFLTSFFCFSQSPGGTSQTTQVWLKANSGTTPSAGTGTLTNWVNHGTSGAVSISGTPDFSSTGYNFNPKTHFNGDGNYLSYGGSTTGAIFAVVELEDLSRVYTHLVTWQDMCFGPDIDGTMHGGINGGLAAYELTGYCPEYESAGVWRHDGIPAAHTDNYSSNHEIISAVANSGDQDQYCDRLLGGQPCLPSRDWMGDASEIILLDAPPSATERDQIESYLAIKYGLTLGINGTSKDYLSTAGTVVWDQSMHTGFNWDITGISRDDATDQDQRKSHTEMWTGGVRNDILTLSNGTNFASPTAIPADESSLIWGHNNGALINTNLLLSYLTDNGELIEAIFSREWKCQESGTINTVTLEFDLSAVPGSGGIIGANDLANLRLLVDEDGDYSDGGATSIAPISYNNTTNIAYFQVDFLPPAGLEIIQNRGFFFTLGTTDVTTTPLPVEFSNFSSDCLANKSTINWTTQSESNADYFEIQRSRDGSTFETTGTVVCVGTTTNESHYSFDLNKAIGTEYVRLIQYDLNGTAHILGIFSINCEENEILVYPNPAKNTLTISAKGILNSDVSIYDCTGRKVIALGEIDLSALQSINISQLTKGFYQIVIQEPEITHSIKFSKL